MITFQKIGNHLWSEPFRPFRIRLSSGRTFDIRDPEMVHVGKTKMRIYTFMSEDTEEAKEHHVEVALLLVESVEPLDIAAQTQGAS